MLNYIIPVLTSVAPVFAFLIILVLFDSYKLLKKRSIFTGIVYGSFIAVIAGGVNYYILNTYDYQTTNYTRYIAPFMEELFKTAFICILIYKGRTGFLIDSAIYGFSIGAGFAFIENIYYIQTLTDPHPVIWIIRGFGTAIMHGGTTSIFAVFYKRNLDRQTGGFFSQAFPGFILAVLIHGIYNQFIFTPMINTLGVLIILPTVFTYIFIKSEKSLQAWLGSGFDSDMEMLQMLNDGKISNTKAGAYLKSIRSNFEPLDVVDMIMILKLHLELSIRAKAVLLSREAGIDVKPTKEVQEKFAEMEVLKKNIGKIGMLTLDPFLHKSKRDLWELHMLYKLK